MKKKFLLVLLVIGMMVSTSGSLFGAVVYGDSPKASDITSNASSESKNINDNNGAKEINSTGSISKGDVTNDQKDVKKSDTAVAKGASEVIKSQAPSSKNSISNSTPNKISADVSYVPTEVASNNDGAKTSFQNEKKINSGAGKTQVILNVKKSNSLRSSSLKASVVSNLKLLEEVNGEFNLIESFPEANFEEYNKKLSQNKKLIITDSEGHIISSGNGIVVTIGGYDDVNKMYSSLDDAKNNKNSVPISGGSFDAQYLGTFSYGGTYYVELQVSGFKGYIPLTYVQILPESKVKAQSNYTVENGKVVLNEPVDPITSNQYSQITLGTNKSLKPGTKYYSYDGSNFSTSPSLEKMNVVGSAVFNYFQNLPLRSSANYTGAQYKAYLTSLGRSNSAYYNATDAFVTAQKVYRVNSLYLMALADHEGLYGTSNYSKEYNNFFGRGAYDSNPDHASFYKFNTPADGILGQAAWLSVSFTDINDSRFFGTHPGTKRDGINALYASDPDWGAKVAEHMSEIDNFLGGKERSKYTIGKVLSASNVYNDSSLKNGLGELNYNGTIGNYTIPKRVNSANGVSDPAEPRLIVTDRTNNAYEVQLPTPINMSSSTTVQYNEGIGGAYPAFLGYKNTTNCPRGAATYGAPYTKWTDNEKWYPSNGIQILSDSGSVKPSDLGSISVKSFTAAKIDSDSFKVSLSLNDPENQMSSIVFPVWSNFNGQDDIVWENAVKNTTTGNYEYTVNIKDHKGDTGLYSIHAYSGDGKSFFGGITYNQSTTMTAGSIKAEATSTGFKVIINDVKASNGISKIQVPTWTAYNGQDDIVWYTAVKQSDGSFVVNVDAKDHKNETGIYDFDVYGFDRCSTSVGLGGSTYKVPEPSLKSIASTPTADGFKITISGITSAINLKSIKVPVWTAKNGQDDIVWYEGLKESNGDYIVYVKTSDHKNERGAYNIGVYGINNSNKYIGLGSSTYVVSEMSAESIELTPTITGFKAVVSGIKAPWGIKSIQIPVWSNKNGQDDLIWYTGVKQIDGSYEADINIKDHNYESGTYIADVYGTDNSGYMNILGGKSITVAENDKLGNISAVSTGENSFRVRVSNLRVPRGVKSIRVPVWTASNGQDDIVWYSGVKDSNGDYIVDVKTSDHKNEKGLYDIHVYGKDTDNKDEFIGATSYVVSEMSAESIELTPTITGFKAVVSGIIAPWGKKSIQIPVWSTKNGQDDLIWYTGVKQIDESYEADINIKDHNYESGTYIADVYGTDNSGYMNILGGKSITVAANDKLGNISAVSTGENSFRVRVSNLRVPMGVKSIRVPVWTASNGQDDIVWYSGVKDSNGDYIVDVKTSDHKNEKGLYDIHVYGKDTDNKDEFIGATSYVVSQMSAESIELTPTITGFKAVVSGIIAPWGTKSIQIPVWSTKNGQDDLIWYTGVKQIDGSYEADINIKDHNYESGTYIADVYGTDNSGYMNILGGKSITVAENDKLGNISAVSTGENSFRVRVSNLRVPRGVKSIRVPVWTASNGQDDIVWYSGVKESNGDYIVDVKTSDHKNEKGLYDIHVYGKDTDNKDEFIGATSYLFSN